MNQAEYGSRNIPITTTLIGLLISKLFGLSINPQTAGMGQIEPLCGFSKKVSSKERVKPWSFVTFNFIISHIFPFINIPQVVQKI